MWRAVLPRPPLCGDEMFAVIATECDVRVSDVSRRSRRTARADRTKICFRKHSDICFCKHSDVVCWPWPNTAAAFGHLLPRFFGHLPPQVFGSLYTPPGTARADWARNHFIHFVHRVSPTLEGRRREMQLSLSRVSTVGPSLAVLCVEPDCIKFIASACSSHDPRWVMGRCGRNGQCRKTRCFRRHKWRDVLAVAPATPMHPRRWLSFPAPVPR